MLVVFSCLLLASTWCGAVGQDALASDNEDHAQSCLLQHSKHKPAERVGASHKHNSSSGQGRADDWRILGVTKYSITSWSSWWSNHDVYAWVTIKPQGLTYKSQVLKSKNEGSLDFYIYVSAGAESADIDLYDEGTLTDSKIGSVSVDLGPGEEWCKLDIAASTGCTFSRSLKKGSGTLDGSLAAGSYLHTQAEALRTRGVAVLNQDSTRTKSKFKQYRIKNDEVEKEMAFAKTGSAFPSGLHGIFWMDQRGRNLPIASDPTYQQVCPTAADELLVSFGQGGWNPTSRCVTGVSVYGSGPFKGQWTWLDDTGSGSTSWASDNESNAVYDFCFENEKMEAINIWTQVSVNSVINNILGFVPLENDVVIAPPAFITNVRMEKKPWGWDRRTTVGPSFLRTLIRSTLGGILGTAGFVGGGLECHYPLFQVVDGDGNRTEHYAAYLEFANNQTDCKVSTFDCHPNLGNGTSFTGRLVGP